MTLPIDAEKAYNEIQYPVTVTTLSKRGLKRNFFNSIRRATKKKKKISSYLMRETEYEPLRLGMNQCPLSLLLFTFVLGVSLKKLD